MLEGASEKDGAVVVGRIDGDTVVVGASVSNFDGAEVGMYSTSGVKPFTIPSAEARNAPVRSVWKKPFMYMSTLSSETSSK